MIQRSERLSVDMRESFLPSIRRERLGSQDFFSVVDACSAWIERSNRLPVNQPVNLSEAHPLKYMGLPAFFSDWAKETAIKLFARTVAGCQFARSELRIRSTPEKIGRPRVGESCDPHAHSNCTTTFFFFFHRDVRYFSRLGDFFPAPEKDGIRKILFFQVFVLYRPKSTNLFRCLRLILPPLKSCAIAALLLTAK